VTTPSTEHFLLYQKSVKSSLKNVWIWWWNVSS